MQLTGVKDVTDIHRENVDNLTIPSKQGKGVLRRIPDVFDCWFESGSMPFASFHYPFSINDEEFDKRFPADFIAEGLDQTRGWFYTLSVLGTIVKNSCPYKNVIVNGIVLASDGNKMSKTARNFPPPMEIVEKQGADAIRLYLMNSTLVKGEQLKFKEDGVSAIVKDVFIPWYHVYRLLLQNINRWELEHNQKWMFDESMFANLDGFKNIMDRWVIAANQELIGFVRKELEAYRLYTVVQKKVKFLDMLSNWYVRLNKNRLQGKAGSEECNSSLNVLFFVLMNSMLTMSPYVPFIVESFFQNMKKCLKTDSIYYEDSIHFLQIPHPKESIKDEKLLPIIDRMQRIIERCRTSRERQAVPIRQPISEILLVFKDQCTIDSMKIVESFIKSEINVAEIKYTTEWKKYIKYKLEPNHKVLGEKYGADYDGLRKKLMAIKEEEVLKFMEEGKIVVDGIEFDEELMFPKAQFTPIKEKNKAIDGSLDFAVVLDLTISEKLKSQGLKREFFNRIQK